MSNILYEKAEEKCVQARNFILDYQKTGITSSLFSGIELYQQSLDIYPNQDEPYIAIAFICQVLGKLIQSKELLIKALKINPLNLYALKMLNTINSKLEEERNIVQEKNIKSTNLKTNVYNKNEFIKNINNFRDSLKETKVKVVVDKNTLNKLSTFTHKTFEKNLTDYTFVEEEEIINPELSINNDFKENQIKMIVDKNTLNKLSEFTNKSSEKIPINKTEKENMDSKLNNDSVIYSLSLFDD